MSNQIKIKTSDLTGPALDWVVARCEGREFEAAESFLSYYDEGGMRYSIDWAQGGPIIERERMQIAPLPDNGWRAHWRSFDNKNWSEVWMDCFDEGVTPLIAAMRCFVASRLGDEVDIPEELQAQTLV